MRVPFLITLGYSQGFGTDNPTSIRSIGIRRFLFKERMLKYRELELLAVLTMSQSDSKLPSQVLDDLYNLSFPWSSIEELEEEASKKEEFLEIWKKKKEQMKNAT